MTSEQLQSLADQYGLPKRQLSEAQEVMLHNGISLIEIPEVLEDLCQNTKAHGGGIANFDKLLKGQIAILKAVP